MKGRAAISTVLVLGAALRASLGAAVTLSAPPPDRSPTAAAPDLEIVALQTTGPGRIGDCNTVVARLHNAGDGPTLEAPAVRLEVAGATLWTRTERAGGALEPGRTAEVWFERVPIEGGRLSQLVVTADPEETVPESNEANNTRRVPREPRDACGAPEPAAPAGVELRVLVEGLAAAPAASSRAPLVGATVSVASPLGAGTVLAAGVTGADGRLSLTVPADARAPVLRVTASAPGCAPEVRLATPNAGSAEPLAVGIELRCAAASAPPPAGAGVLEIETALPGLLRLDDAAPQAVTFGSRVTVRRPGETVRVRATSVNATVFHDATLEVPPDGTREVVVDAPHLLVAFTHRAQPQQTTPADTTPATGDEGGADDVVEDLRSGLLWTVGAAITPGFAAAGAICDGLDRGGTTAWRLPEIDELAYVLGSDAGSDALQGAAACCLWSSTEHSGLRLTFYLEGGHIYGRRAEEGGLGTLCVTGRAYEVDPLLVPQRYHDRLPAPRSFRPAAR